LATLFCPDFFSACARFAAQRARVASAIRLRASALKVRLFLGLRF
jgi:hypothetical protein